ncbi:BQ5605_C014g07533 [Microbotryum silenes-dioicae]|uniref:BQ5605_C014g07533 protein n=1 Tax=Microbotryum silenes-dioicae TaxID=796604 RepID=A0A2X0LXT3_9BASI|nr:BQ5605_C014g07533 [Microbotryum silenes-dioicae]
MRATLLFLVICCLIVSTLSRKWPPGALRENPGTCAAVRHMNPVCRRTISASSSDCMKKCDGQPGKDGAECYAACSFNNIPCKRVTILVTCLHRCDSDGTYVYNPPGNASQQVTTCSDGVGDKKKRKRKRKSCCMQGCCTIVESVE